MDVDKQDKKRKKGDVSSDLDTSGLDGDLSYLDLDTKTVVTAASTPQQGKCDILSNKSYDQLMRKITAMERCMSKLDKLDKLDKMEQSVRQMELKMDRFDKRIQKTEDTVNNVETSVKFVTDQYDEIVREKRTENAKLKDMDARVNEMKRDNDELKLMLFEMRKLNTELKEDMLDMKSRSMRDNLLFTNIQENENENTEQVLQNFLMNKMNITDISFERVHRLNRKASTTWQDRRPRTIVAKFTYFKDRERIRKSGRLLKGTQFGIQEQFPNEIEGRRKPLYPLLRQARQDQKKAAMVKDRLFVEGKEVFARSVPSTSKEPESSQRSAEGATGGILTEGASGGTRL